MASTLDWRHSVYRSGILSVCLISCLILLAGCGGGGSSPGEVKGQLTSSEGRYAYEGWPLRPADLWMCTALQNGRGTVVMRSSDLDSEPEIGEVRNDGSLTAPWGTDDLGIGGDEEAEFQAVKDQVYFVIATTSNNGPETGSYSLTFSKEFGNVRQVKLDPGQVILTTNSARLLRGQPVAKHKLPIVR